MKHTLGFDFTKKTSISQKAIDKVTDAYMDKQADDSVKQADEEATYGVSLDRLKNDVINGVMTPDEAAVYVAKLECEKYNDGSHLDEPWECYYDPNQFTNLQSDTFERKVLNGLTVSELRELVKDYGLDKQYAAEWFAYYYSKHFGLKFVDYYDVNSFDPDCNFGFDIKKDGE